MTSIGTSTSASIPFVVGKMEELHPRRILDVGCGWGRWGFLGREFLDFWFHRFDRQDWLAEIVGIDVNPNNWTQVQSGVYTRCVTADIRAVDLRDFVLPGSEEAWKPDMLIATDVLEHMPTEHAMLQVQHWVENVDDVILGVPLDHGLRGGHPDNPAEAHLSEWDAHKWDPARARWPACKLVSGQLTHTEEMLPYGLYHLRRDVGTVL